MHITVTGIEVVHARNRAVTSFAAATMSIDMRRWLRILLLVIVPLQISWAAASAYCTHHEGGDAARHFGHHADQHPDSDADPRDNADPDSQKAVGLHHGHHHLGGTLGIASSVELPAHAALGTHFAPAVFSRLASAPRARIERPKWVRFA